MRVTILDAGTGDHLMSLVDGTPLNDFPLHGMVAALEYDGLDGWHEGIDPKYEDPGEMPSQAGAFWPEKVFLASRLVTIRGFVALLGDGGSTVSLAAARDGVAALVGRALRVSVHDESGFREVTGYLPSRTTHTRVSGAAFKFTLIIQCPDPLKYGLAVTHVLAAGLHELELENTGTGDVAFTVSTGALITSLDVQYGGNRVTWGGNSNGLVLDLADGRPLNPAGNETGSLVAADLIRIPSGRHTVTVTADAPVTVTLRPGWK